MHKIYVRFKRDLNRRSERLKTRPRGESTEKGRGKAEIQNELLPLSKKHSQGKQSACFSAEEVRRLKGRLGCAERRRSSEKREERRTVRALLQTEKRDEEFGMRRNRFGRLKKFPAPPMPEVSAQLRCKSSKKAKAALLFLRLVRHCRWLPRIFSKVRSTVPKNPSEQKSGSPEVQAEGQ